MARYHYIITAKKRLKEETESDGTKTVKIKEVTEIVENGKVKYDPDSIDNGQEKGIDNFLLFVAASVLLIVAILMAIARDIYGLENNIFKLTSDYVASVGILSMLLSMAPIKEFIGRKLFCFGKIGNKLCVCIMTLVVAFIIPIFLLRFGLTEKLSNSIGILCFVVTIINLK